MTGFDVIGDVHGHADRVRGLLARMGYAERHGVWAHPRRTAVFVGDLIDRGPGPARHAAARAGDGRSRLGADRARQPRVQRRRLRHAPSRARRLLPAPQREEHRPAPGVPVRRRLRLAVAPLDHRLVHDDSAVARPRRPAGGACLLERRPHRAPRGRGRPGQHPHRTARDRRHDRGHADPRRGRDRLEGSRGPPRRRAVPRQGRPPARPRPAALVGQRGDHAAQRRC